jgi:hypothetical protein
MRKKNQPLDVDPHLVEKKMIMNMRNDQLLDVDHRLAMNTNMKIVQLLVVSQLHVEMTITMIDIKNIF